MLTWTALVILPSKFVIADSFPLETFRLIYWMTVRLDQVISKIRATLDSAFLIPPIIVANSRAMSGLGQWTKIEFALMMLFIIQK